MIYPECPATFWTCEHILKLFKKKATMPPLGLLTVAALLPKEFECSIIDMNTTPLLDHDITEADYIMISAMIIQKESTLEVIQRCRKLNATIIVGGPLFTSSLSEYTDVDHFIIGEAENTLPQFLEDLKNGTLKKTYSNEAYPNLQNIPVPRFDLINLKDYFQLPIQFSRGCPNDCEFCEITSLNGRIPRTKTPEQVIAELDFAKSQGWRGRVFFVDDNFIANKKQTKILLKKLIEWRKTSKFQSVFFAEVPINAADDEELLHLMSQAKFSMVFVGIETPSLEGLQECGKHQNTNRNLIDSVRKFYQHGIKVAGGFIIGFDSDDEAIFDKQLNFIQEAGIPLAMIGMLNAMPNTRLYKRLEAEGRLISSASGNNTGYFLNIEPKMGAKNLLRGYKQLLKSAYSPEMYYSRILNLVKYYNPVIKSDVRKKYILSVAVAIFRLGFLTGGRRYFWAFLMVNLFKYPRAIFWGIESAMSYMDFNKLYKDI
jgi:radical SAM superfamily enzyme YgiQ (UPF0313 family)